MTTRSELEKSRRSSQIESDRACRRDQYMYEVKINGLKLEYEKLCYWCDGKGYTNNSYSNYVDTYCDTCNNSGHIDVENNFDSILDLESFLESKNVVSYKSKGLFARLFNLE